MQPTSKSVDGDALGAVQKQTRWVDALADCGRARALNPALHKALRRLFKTYEELDRPGQALKPLQEFRTLRGVTSADSAELLRMVLQLEAQKHKTMCLNHFRMLNAAFSATVRPRLLPRLLPRLGDAYWMTLQRSIVATSAKVSNVQHACRLRRSRLRSGSWHCGTTPTKP